MNLSNHNLLLPNLLYTLNLSFVCSRLQVHSTSFDFSNACDLLLHLLVLRNLNNYVYLKWHCSYSTNRISHVVSSGNFSSPYRVLSGVSQWSALRSLHFDMFIKELSNVLEFLQLPSFINFYICLHEIKFPHDMREIWTLFPYPVAK